MQKTTMIGFDDGEETVTIQLERGTACIANDGTCFISDEHHGKHINLFDPIAPYTDDNYGLCNSLSQGIQVSKKAEITNYLYLLFEAQKSGHDVHIEIRDALQQYKDEAGI